MESDLYRKKYIFIFFSCDNFHTDMYYMAGSASGQDEANSVF